MNRKLVFGLMLLVMAFAAVACGGGGGASNNTSSSTSGSPSDAVKGYLAAALTGQGDGASFLCSSIPDATKQQMQSSFDTIKNTYASTGATLDISGLTYTEQNVSGDSGEVVVAGKMKVTVSGQSNDIDYPSSTIPVKQEGGAWKVCG